MGCAKQVLFFKNDGEWNVRFEEPVDPPSDPETDGKPEGDGTAVQAPGTSQLARDPSPPLVANDDDVSIAEAHILPTNTSDPSDSELDEEYNSDCVKCTNPHDGKLIMQQQFPINIDQMFTMIFTESQFSTELLAARQTFNYRQSPWEEQNEVMSRQLCYTLKPSAGILGTIDVHLTETQVLNKSSRPGALYSIDCTSDSAGVPFEGCFLVCVHYCLQRVTQSSTMLSFYGEVKFKRPIFFLFRAPIKKDSLNGMEEFCRLLKSKLNECVVSAVPAAREARTLRQRTASSQEPVSSPAPAPDALASFPAPPSARATPSARWRLLAVVLMLLLAITLVYTLILYRDLLCEAWSDFLLF